MFLLIDYPQTFVFSPAAFVICRKNCTFTEVIQSADIMKSGLVLLTVLSLLSACSSDYLTSIHTLEQSVIDNPKGVVDSLTLMKPDYPRMTAKEQAYYSLIYAMALDKSYIDTTDVSILDPAVKYYAKHGSPREKMLTYYYLGRIQGNARQYSESLISLTKALEQDWDDDAYRGRAFMAIADAYNYSFNYHEEALYVDSASFYYNRTRDSLLARVARYRIAVSAINLKKIQKAKLILDELLQKNDLETHLKAACLQQSAYLIALMDDSSQIIKALNQYEESISMGQGMTDGHAAAYAYLLSRSGQSDVAQIIFYSLDSLSAVSKAKADSWRSLICYHSGKMEEAYKLQERSLEYQDSIVIETLNQSLVATQRDYYIDKTLREQQYIMLLRTREVVILLSIALFLCFLSAGIMYFRKKEIKKVSLYESTLEELKSELFTQTREEVSLREQFKRVYKRHFDLLASFYEEYDIQRRNGVSEEERNRQVLKIINTLQGDKESDNRFEAIVDEDLNGIITEFRKDFPDFSELDYRLFCYYVAGFSTKFISMIVKNTSADTLYVRKCRMKKEIKESNCPRRQRYLEYL